MTYLDFVKKLQKELNILGAKPQLVTDGDPGVKTQAELAKYDVNFLFKKLTLPSIVLSPSQQKGYDFIVNKWKAQATPFSDIRWLAYALATAWHETAFTFEPVIEYGGEAYLKSKDYYPYYGRGYVQLTWKSNYEKYGIAQTPERALDPDFAAHILIDGMIRGVFTGKKLGDYFNETKNDPIQARRIVNGTRPGETLPDRAEQIAGYYQKFLNGLST